MQRQMDEFEMLIKRFIRKKLSNLNPRDIDYAVSEFRRENSKIRECLLLNKVLGNIYHHYKLGNNIMEILHDEKFYTQLPYKDYPEIFKVEPSVDFDILNIPESEVADESTLTEVEVDDWEPIRLGNLKMPSEITFIKEQLPHVQKTVIRGAKQYIAIMELISWVDKKGIIMPDIKPMENLTLSKTTEEVRLIKVKELITRHLNSFNKSSYMDTKEYERLVSSLEAYFTDDKLIILETPIKIERHQVRKLSYQLGQLYKKASAHGSMINFTYHEFCVNNISILQKYKCDATEFEESNLRKYFTSNPNI